MTFVSRNCTSSDYYLGDILVYFSDSYTFCLQFFLQLVHLISVNGGL